MQENNFALNAAQVGGAIHTVEKISFEKNSFFENKAEVQGNTVANVVTKYEFVTENKDFYQKNESYI